MKPNKYALALDAFMQAKSKRMRVKRYYLEEDSKELLSLPIKEAKKIVSDILYNKARGLGHWACPFCWMHQNKNAHFVSHYDCSSCNYGKRHGECAKIGVVKNDYTRFASPKVHLFTSHFYKKLFGKIRKEYSI